MIKKLHISNYKSVKELDLNCERINVLVGEPNAGKSNILEALDLSFLSWMMGMNKDNTKAGKDLIDLKRFFRINKAEGLFHSGNIATPIVISHPEFASDTMLEYQYNRTLDKSFFTIRSSASFTHFDNDLNPIEPVQFSASPIKPYRYKEQIQFHDIGNYIHRLMAPYGNNLAKVIYYNADMKKLAKDFAGDYGFEFNINAATDEINIQLRLNEGVVYTLPFEAMADTFKRILFYIAAIRHSGGAVITLDEPDTHAFPNYVSLLADEMIGQRDCQFFITTHNPYLLNELVEKTPKGELAVFVCGYSKVKNSTIARRLTDDDLSELLNYGVDIFFNINRYLNDGIEYSA